MEFELELKGYGRGFLDDVVAEVVDRDVLDRVEFTSSNVALLAILKSELPAAQRSGSSRNPVLPFSLMKPSSTTSSALPRRHRSTSHTCALRANITTTIVTRLHDLGFRVHANDAMSHADVQRAIDVGADRCSTNDIKLAMAATDQPTI